MKTQSILHMAGTLFAAATIEANGAEISLVCPTQLPAESIKIATVPEGWQPFISSPLYLHSAAPIAGPPERLGRMVGRTIKGARGESITLYGNLDAPYPEGLWLSCDYGVDNAFSIAKKLPAGVKACVVRSKKGEKAGQNDLDIKCK